MNSLSHRYLDTDSSLTVILEQRLAAANSTWRKLQRMAAAKQESLARSVYDPTQRSDEARQISAFRENFALLRSLYWDSSDEPSGADRVSPISDEFDEESVYGDDLKRQMELHELFEGLAFLEEEIVSEEFVDGDMTAMMEALARMPVRTRLRS